MPLAAGVTVKGGTPPTVASADTTMPAANPPLRVAEATTVAADRLLDVGLAEQLRIDEHEIAHRKGLLGIDEADIRTLCDCRRNIAASVEAIVDEYYWRETAIPELALIIGDADTLARLKVTMRRYVLDLFEGYYDLTYVNNRLRIGKVHHRIGVTLKYYIAAVVALEEIIGTHLLSVQEMADARAFEKLTARKVSLHKLMMFDMQLVVDTYSFSLYAEIEAAKRKADAAVIDLEAVVAERTRRLEELSTTDELTQLGNQRSFFDTLRKEVARAERYRLPLTLIYFDVDKFKQLNDNEGHAVGDDLLRLVGETVRLVVRQVDLAFRYGGDEFCVLAPSTEGEGGLQLCHRLAEAFRHRSERSITFSMGVASVGPEHYCPPDELLRRADQAMYAAKRGSRHGGGVRLRLAAKGERAEPDTKSRR